MHEIAPLHAFTRFLAPSAGLVATRFFELTVVRQAGGTPDAQRSTREPWRARPAAGSIRTRSLSKTFTDIAFPICLPNWALETATLKDSGCMPCMRIISALVMRRDRFVTQCPPARLHVRHGVTSLMYFILGPELSQSTMKGSVSGLSPCAEISFSARFTLARAVVWLAGGSCFPSPNVWSRKRLMLGRGTGSGNSKEPSSQLFLMPTK
mmetsp:Transcript_74560/g.168938  ORF Transcript_74560/g.168938 Transcript_74560/m.168938 type:complete len:209 (-) Transcript_74560:244-870(-)